MNTTGDGDSSKPAKEDAPQSQTTQLAPYVPPHRRGNKTGEEQGSPMDYRPSVRPSDPRSNPTPGVTGRSLATRTHRQHPHHKQQRNQPGVQVVPRRADATAYDDSDAAVLCRVLDRVRCINMASRPEKWKDVQAQAKRVGLEFHRKLERFDAIDGQKILLDLEEKSSPDTPSVGDTNRNNPSLFDESVIRLQWDATKNAVYSSRVTASIKTMTAGEVGCAASHIQLWRELAHDKVSANNESGTCWMILEDDIRFTTDSRGKSRFVKAFVKAWKQLPQDGWGILYLGISSRGERHYLDELLLDDTNKIDRLPSLSSLPNESLRVRLYRPSYGFQTHAYVLTRSAARQLLHQLPVIGPLDVWLADNDWFGIATYCAVIANEGWKLDDGTYEGANLVSQQKHRWSSDVQQSSSLVSSEKSPWKTG